MTTVQQWATCASTELAFVRLYTNPAAVGGPRPAQEALGILSELLRDPRHRFWSEMPSVAEFSRAGAFGKVLGHNQINDAYLLELARRKGGRLLTFDRRLEALGAEGVAEVLAP